VSKLLLFFIEPLGCERCVGEEGPSTKSDESSDGSLDDEEPSPPCHSSGTIELEDTGGDQTCECGCEDISCTSVELRRWDVNLPVYKMAIRVATSVRV
jgi:hypothetical protein